MHTALQPTPPAPHTVQPVAPPEALSGELTDVQLTTVVGAGVIINQLTAAGGATPLRPFVPCV